MKGKRGGQRRVSRTARSRVKDKEERDVVLTAVERKKRKGGVEYASSYAVRWGRKQVKKRKKGIPTSFLSGGRKTSSLTSCLEKEKQGGPEETTLSTPGWTWKKEEGVPTEEKRDSAGDFLRGGGTVSYFGGPRGKRGETCLFNWGCPFLSAWLEGGRKKEAQPSGVSFYRKGEGGGSNGVLAARREKGCAGFLPEFVEEGEKFD